MGGLLIADAVLAIANSRAEKTALLWPRIIACIAFDTPYYGLHPFVFKNQTSKVVTYAQGVHQLASGLGLFSSVAGGSSKPTAASKSSSKEGAEQLALVSTAPSSSQSSTISPKGAWSKWAPAALGAVVAGAAAGAAFYNKEELTSSVGWAGDHLKYVGNLWDKQTLQRRVDSLVAVRKESGVHFHKYARLHPLLSSGGLTIFMFTASIPTFQVPRRIQRLGRLSLSPERLRRRSSIIQQTATLSLKTR